MVNLDDINALFSREEIEERKNKIIEDQKIKNKKILEDRAANEAEKLEQETKGHSRINITSNPRKPTPKSKPKEEPKEEPIPEIIDTIIEEDLNSIVEAIDEIEAKKEVDEIAALKAKIEQLESKEPGV